MSEIPPSAVDADPADAGPLGIYVHVPFCASTCDFCAFYQTSPTADGVRMFLSSIEQELALVDWSDRSVCTIFWGGGTPGLLSPADLSRLAALVRRRAGNAVRVWTAEMAPASVTDARLAALKDAGVTRISMGVQSFNPELLDALGRQHTREQIFRAYDRVRRAEFQSVNLDLMFALPGQAEDAWTDDLDQALALQPDHLSTYCLTFEEDTKLWVKLSRGQVKLDPAHEARLYETTWERLAAAGFTQYEVSNFARPGHTCLHNLNTWRMHEWVGVGPSAASQYRGWRGANVADLNQWATQVSEGVRMTEDRVALGDSLLAEDALIFGLRMNEGVDLQDLRRRFPAAPHAAANAAITNLVTDGLAERSGTRVRLTTRGRLVADSVGAAIMEAMTEPATT